MTRLPLLVAVLIVMLFGSPAFGQLAPQSDTCDGCPFDQGAELDAACPNGICSFFVVGNFTGNGSGGHSSVDKHGDGEGAPGEVRPRSAGEPG